MRDRVISNILGLIGAVLGGILGYVVFAWLVKRGFYGMMIPGALLGLGCSLLALHRSLPRGVLCGVAVLALGLYTEWKFFSFVADDSFSYMVKHIHEKGSITQLMLGLGAVFGFWMGKDANPLFSSRQSPDGRPSSKSG